MYQRLFLVFIIAASLTLSACTALQLEPTPTVTPLPPTETATPRPPTATLEPTLTPTRTPRPYVEGLGERIEMPAGGFSFQPPVEFEVDDSISRGVYLYDPDRISILGLFGYSNYSDTYSELLSGVDYIDSMLAYLEDSTGGVFDKGEQYPIIVSSLEGIAYDLKSSSGKYILDGKLFAVERSENLFFTGYYILRSGPGHAEREILFEKVLSSISFIEYDYAASNLCPISTNEKYGYSPGYPIKVGGAEMFGPRNRAYYLDSLIGPNGEEVHHSKVGVEVHDGVTLDKYEVWYDGGEEIIILYLDKFNYEYPKAPVGFLCWRRIPSYLPEIDQE